VLAMHISNTALEIAPVVQAIAAELGLESLLFHVWGDPKLGSSESEWILVAPGKVFDAQPALVAMGVRGSAPADFPVWTDDYSNLLRILR
jgi:hypothetical protein